MYVPIIFVPSYNKSLYAFFIFLREDVVRNKTHILLTRNSRVPQIQMVKREGSSHYPPIFFCLYPHNVICIVTRVKLGGVHFFTIRRNRKNWFICGIMDNITWQYKLTERFFYSFRGIHKSGRTKDLQSDDDAYILCVQKVSTYYFRCYRNQTDVCTA